MNVPLHFDGARVSGHVAPQGSRSTFWSVASTFTEARFERLRLRDVQFGAGPAISQYINCSFDGSWLSLAPGGRARFVGCTFEEVRITGWHLSFADLIDCRFSGRIETGIFYSRNEWGVATVRGNDFSNAVLNDVAFRGGVDLSQQKLPVGPGYLYLGDAAATFRAARREIVAWDDLPARQEALTYLSVWEPDVEEGQRQLLIQRDLKVRGVTNAWGRFIDVLATHAT